MTQPLPKKPRAAKRRGRHPAKALSAAFCRTVSEAGRYSDGNGLYLHVDPSGARRWVQKLTIRGKVRVLGLGGYSLVSLADAREQALANRKLARSGGDPLATKRRRRAMPTFEEAASEVLKQKRAAWRNSKHAKDWSSSLRKYAFPDMADAVAVVRASRAWIGTKLAFEFLVLTAARSGEVRLATWEEIDIGSAVWTVPGSRMKAKWDHRVPLCGRTVEILHEARPLGGETGLLFPSSRGNPLSNMTMSKLVKEQGIAAVPHGFRSSFRDWAAERTNHPREVIEAALAHVVANRVEAAYARSDLFARRRRLMDDWAGYLGEERGRVIPMRR